MTKKLLLGNGFKKMEGYITIDSDASTCPDYIRDLSKGLPFDDNSIDEIYSEHLLEHVQDIKFLMEESYRVLKEGGRFIYVVPSIRGNGAFRHHEHCHFFTEDWHLFYTTWALQNGYHCFFELVKQEEIQESDGTYVLKGELIKRGRTFPHDNSGSFQRIINSVNCANYRKPYFIFINNNFGHLMSHNYTKEQLTELKDNLGRFFKENEVK